MASIDISNLKKTKKKPAGTPESVTSQIAALFEKDFSFGGSGLSDEKKEYLYLELGALLRAGVDFKSAFELVASGQKKPQDAALFNRILQDVVEGASFSMALKGSGKFTLYEIYSIEIGEESGQLQQVLADLAYFYKTKITQRRTIISALTYPAIVLSASVGALAFMMRFVVPMFSDIFRRSGGELPWITQKMIAISDGFGLYGGTAALAVIVLIAVAFYYRNTLWFRDYASRIVLRTPLAGPLTQKIYLARLSNAMRLLINARLPLLRAIMLCRQMIGFFPLEKALAVIERDILSGVQLHMSMQQFAVFPPKMIQLIKVGERTNQLDAFFEWIGSQYVAEAELQTASLSRIMQPVIIIILGIVVGVIVIAIYLPLFQISSNIQ
ncbi:type II secretion system F family protein [Mucilaginibacter sp. AK015]|uniref:type II secretion system F family protein n=1 Tax=Mucilaginibacter sp. AK015 TaxID=2723072 RepID=UPI00161389A4|nr:type II secretion system F family protein [Mucilaginibacter sp. AK015]MBB5395100.1 type IV pilus assembly protein PilC [Mucilaginibacter sp. AK015]